MRKSYKDRSGFALVIVLGLVGFLVLLILSMGLFFGVEKRKERNRRSEQIARENARYGLQVALGELQELAGPDQRITAEGDIGDGGEGDRKHWVGVWNPKEEMRFEGWLVSGEGEDVVFKCGEEDMVKVGKVELDGLGHYGYWVEDLGVSGRSAGVLSNVVKGGLKKDLTAFLEGRGGLALEKGIFERPDEVEGEMVIPKWGLVRSFYNYKSENGVIKPRPMVPVYRPIPGRMSDVEGRSEGPREYGVGPVMTQAVVGFAPSYVDGKLNLHYFVGVALWNPHDVGLEKEDYIFDITAKKQGNLRPVFEVNEKVPLEVKEVDESSVSLFRGRMQSSFKAGEVKVFSVSRGQKLDLDGGNRMVEGGDLKGSVVWEVGGSNPKGGGRLRMEKSGVGWPALSLRLSRAQDQVIYQEIRELRDDRNVRGVDIVGLEEVVPDQPYLYAKYKVKVLSGEKNYRAPVVDGYYSEEAPYFLGASREVENLEGNWDSVWGTKDDPGYYRMDKEKGGVLYKVRRGGEEVVSLGYLQYVNLTPFMHNVGHAVGNSFEAWRVPRDKVFKPGVSGSNRDRLAMLYDYSHLINEALWDEYFFSGYRVNSGKLKNKHYRVRTEADRKKLRSFEACGGCLLVEGMFNVNSTSKEAWTRVLETSGVRGRQVEKLAEEVVRQVKLRGPFKSLGDFVNRRLVKEREDEHGLGRNGALQAAIGDGGALVQGDLLEESGPILNVRSDTFLIRAYGEAERDGKTKAGCESIAQRIPEYVESEKNKPEAEEKDLSEVNQKLGRRFKVVSFRWLTSEEL